MATTIPNVLRALANRKPMGFTKGELIEAFIREGYNPEKAYRRFKQVFASGEIQPWEDGLFITIYSPAHYKLNPGITDVHIKAVKIARDGTIIYLS